MCSIFTIVWVSVYKLFSIFFLKKYFEFLNLTVLTNSKFNSFFKFQILTDFTNSNFNGVKNSNFSSILKIEKSKFWTARQTARILFCKEQNQHKKETPKKLHKHTWVPSQATNS